ncbi:PTS lactose/cellobiose transporter subunit IIA [Granulicatella elegans]|uniref:PTS lactose/cellobiose transporter subunit IIA n=1 Tax=Granulicatella elegans TaxID=137732 RepID=UPI003C72E6E5
MIKNDKEKCEECLKQAHLSLVETHNDQIKLICLEANESDVQLNLITIHSSEELIKFKLINSFFSIGRK